MLHKLLRTSEAREVFFSECRSLFFLYMLEIPGDFYPNLNLGNCESHHFETKITRCALF